MAYKLVITEHADELLDNLIHHLLRLVVRKDRRTL